MRQESVGLKAFKVCLVSWDPLEMLVRPVHQAQLARLVNQGHQDLPDSEVIKELGVYPDQQVWRASWDHQDSGDLWADLVIKERLEIPALQETWVLLVDLVRRDLQVHLG